MISPWVGSTRRAVRAASNDLPHPVGPVMPNVVPVGMVRESWLISLRSSISSETSLNSIS